MAIKFTDKTIDYARNPRNEGEIEDPTSIGEVSNPDCGDSTIVYLKVEDGVIKDCRFETFGCTAAVAASSMLTELVIGKTIEEADELTANMIADALGGLPERKLHCSMVGIDALKKAIDNFRKGVVTDEEE